MYYVQSFPTEQKKTKTTTMSPFREKQRLKVPLKYYLHLFIYSNAFPITTHHSHRDFVLYLPLLPSL